MTQDTTPFFSPISRRMQIPDEDYALTAPYVAMADALSRSTNHSLYLIDYNRRDFLYVSPNPLFLCGRMPEEVRRLGYAFYFEVVPPEELQTLLDINEAGFRFYYAQPVEKRTDFIIEYDFHIRTTDRHTHLVHHKLTPVLLSPQGDIWLALCVVSLSPTPQAGDVLITDKASGDRHVYSFTARRWRKQPPLILNERERDILQLSVKGLSNAEIGAALFIDANTVKYHKKNVFEKLQAENITEAVGIAANLGLI